MHTLIQDLTEKLFDWKQTAFVVQQPGNWFAIEEADLEEWQDQPHFSLEPKEFEQEHKLIFLDQLVERLQNEGYTQRKTCPHSGFKCEHAWLFDKHHITFICAPDCPKQYQKIK